jgi:hypothetical protein
VLMSKIALLKQGWTLFSCSLHGLLYTISLSTIHYCVFTVDLIALVPKQFEQLCKVASAIY